MARPDDTLRKKRRPPPDPSDRQRLDDIAANVRGVVWEAWRTPDGEVQRVDFVSRQLEAMLGYSTEEWLSRPNFWLSIVHPDDRERAEREAALILAGGRGGTSRFRWIGKSGRIIWVESQSVVTTDKAGNPTGMRGVSMDITARVEAEESVLRQQNFTEAIAASLAEGIYATDPAGRLTFINPAGEQMLGWTRAELLGRTLHDIVHPRRADGTPFPLGELPLFRAALSGVPMRDHEDLFTRKDGGTFPVVCTSAPILMDNVVTGVVLTFLDISERRRTERRRGTRHQITQIIAESSALEQSARHILQVLCDGVGWDAGALWLVDRDAARLRCLEFWPSPGVELGEFEVATRASTFSLGSGLPGRVWESGSAAWIRDMTRDASFWRGLLTGPTPLRGAFAAPIRAGSECLGVLEFFCQEIVEPDDELLEIMATLGSQIGLFLERKRTEREILQRNQDLRTLLYVVSHDLKEPLRAVESFSGMLQSRHNSALDPSGQDLLRRVVKGADRLRRILDDIVMLSRVRMMGSSKQEVAGEVLVREALARLEHKVSESRARVSLAADLPRLLVDRTWATQAIYNLLSNALKFARPDTPPEIEIAGYPDSSSGEPGVGLVVRDRGPGVDEEIRERIFELFQRGVGREVEGTGAGLAIVREVANRHGGRAWVEPRPGGGSQFVVVFGGSGPAELRDGRPA